MTPYIEVRPTQVGLNKMHRMTRVWRRSWLYQSLNQDRLILSYDELPDSDDRFVAVLGQITLKDLRNLVTEHLE